VLDRVGASAKHNNRQGQHGRVLLKLHVPIHGQNDLKTRLARSPQQPPVLKLFPSNTAGVNDLVPGQLSPERLWNTMVEEHSQAAALGFADVIVIQLFASRITASACSFLTDGK
jgi:hypothetical protein